MKNNNESLAGVIMAAGKGTRMESFSKKYPKCILPVCNKPIMEHHIETMKKMGVCDIIVVIGHLGYEIVKKIGDGKEYGVNIRYVEQGENLGIAHAVGTIESHIHTPFLLFLGDIFFISEDISAIINTWKSKKSSAVLAVKEENDPEMIRRNFAIQLDDSGLVKRVIEKPRYVTNKLKGCGIYLFDLHIFDAIRRTPRTAMRNEYELTDSIQILIDDGFPVSTEEVIKEDINITFPDDLLRCNLNYLKYLGKSKLIGKNTSLHGAVVENSIIGDNSDIRGAKNITNSMIFPETKLSVKKRIDSCIVTQDRIFDCSGDDNLKPRINDLF